MEKIKLIAHRGGYKESGFRENSKEAIKYIANKDYVDGIEFDIRLTKDKKIVLIHNPSIKLNGKKYIVSDTSYEKLNKIYMELFKEKINTLDEIMVLIPKQKTIFLEIKDLNLDTYEEDLKLVLQTIKKYPSKQIFIISFNQKYLKYFKKYDYPTCLLIGLNQSCVKLKIFFESCFCKSVNMITMNRILFRKKYGQRILMSNKLLGIYTLDDIKELEILWDKIGEKIITKYKNNIYLTTSNPKKIYKGLKLLNEKS